MWAREHGHAPDWADWACATKEYPCYGVVVNHYGSFARMLRRAGLPSPPAHVNRRGARWSDEQILDALRAWAATRGRAPWRVEWSRAAAEHPSNGTVVSHFGSWKEGLRRAGLRSPPPRTSR
jgi:hypothetical protein